MKPNQAKRKKKYLQLSLLAIIIFGLSPVITTGQSACTDQVAGKSRAQLEQELEACNKEIAEWTKVLNETRQDSASFSRDIAALTTKTNTTQTNIKTKNITTPNLTKNTSK